MSANRYAYNALTKIIQNGILMKKLLLVSLVALLLPACADRNQYEQAILEQMQKEQDLKDYKITPEYMTKCVLESSTQNMPGIFALDPKRLMAYRNYAKMLTLFKNAAGYYRKRACCSISQEMD